MFPSAVTGELPHRHLLCGEALHGFWEPCLTAALTDVHARRCSPLVALRRRARGRRAGRLTQPRIPSLTVLTPVLMHPSPPPPHPLPCRPRTQRRTSDAKENAPPAAVQDTPMKVTPSRLACLGELREEMTCAVCFEVMTRPCSTACGEQRTAGPWLPQPCCAVVCVGGCMCMRRRGVHAPGRCACTSACRCRAPRPPDPQEPTTSCTPRPPQPQGTHFAAAACAKRCSTAATAPSAGRRSRQVCAACVQRTLCLRCLAGPWAC